MALIQCPECGQTVSDQAGQCPKCGFPLGNGAPAEETMVPAPIQTAHDYEKAKKTRTYAILACIAVAVIAIAAGIVILITTMSNKHISINKVTIDRWKLTDSTSDYDYYDGTVTSDETKPFVAVMGYYGNEASAPSLVYMENGTGTISTSVETDEDPSVIYRPLGYMPGKAVDDSDISKLTCKDRDYNDFTYSEFSSCDVDVEVELKNSANGILFLELRNDITNEVKYNCRVVIVNGKGTYSYYLSDMPLKTRGVKVTATPKFFCPGSEITESEFQIEKGYTTEKDEGKYITSYVGKQEIAIADKENGYVIYTKELLSGGKKENRGDVVNTISYLRDGKCTLTTFDMADNEEEMKTADYDLQVIGYIPWTEVNNLNAGDL